MNSLQNNSYLSLFQNQIMMIHHYKFFKYAWLFIIFILFNQADCSHNDDPTCYFTNEFNSYTIFAKDSFWVYQNQDGTKDTVRITKIERLIIDGYHSYPDERFNITKTSTLSGTEKFYALCQDADNPIGCDHYNTFRSNYSHQCYFFCCCEEGKKFQTLTYVGELDIIVHEIDYPQTRHFISDSLFSTSLKAQYYAPNIGLVKYEDFDQNTWELIDYKVERYLED